MIDLDRRNVLGATAALAYAYSSQSQAGATTTGLAGALIAPGPHPSLGKHAETYGRLVGKWRGEYRLFRPQGTQTGAIEVTFGWILEGRVIQDSGWMLEGLAPGADGPGTTLRFYDPDIDAWRIIFIDPIQHRRAEMVGRRVGNDVIQQGYLREHAVKWTFTDVTPESFIWRGYYLADDGEKWVLQDEYRFRRVT